MRKSITIIILFLLATTGMNAQIVTKANKGKIASDIKEGVNNAIETLNQHSHPTGEHELWDGYIAPKVGLGISSLPGAGGRPELGFVGGVYVEAFVAKNLGLSMELTYQHQGANRVRYSEYAAIANADGEIVDHTVNTARYDYNLDYINTYYLIHWYPWPTRPISFYTGLQLSRLVNAKSEVKGSSTADIKDRLHKGELNIPIGVSWEVGQWEFDARYFFSPREIAKTRQAKAILGNARNMSLSLTVAYRIRIF